MNMLKLIGLLLRREVNDIIEAGHENVVHTMRLLYIAIAVPAVTIVAGIAVGAVGESLDASWMVTLAHYMAGIAGFMAALLLTLFWVRGVVLVHLIVVATKGVNVASGDRIPDVELEPAQAFLRWLRGVTLWITAVALYAQIIPVWNNIAASLVVGTCILLFSAMMSAKWFEGRWLKRIVMLSVVSIFLFNTAALVSPSFAHSTRSTVERYFDHADGENARELELLEIDREARERYTAVDADLLRRLNARQEEIRRRVAELCNGRFCNEAERAEFEDNEERIRRLRDGTYWTHYSAAERTGTGAARVPAPPPVTNGSRGGGNVSSLPPPPGALDDEEPPPATARRTAARPVRLTPSDLDDVFRELDNYPDLDE